LDIITQLVERCREDDRQAQFEIYQKYSKAMYNIALRMVRDSDEAQDVLQDAFIAAFKSIKTYNGTATFGAWLKRIVINKCLDFLKKRKLDIVDVESVMYKIEAPETEADDAVFYGVSAELVHHEIKKLPAGCRVIFNMYLLEGYDHQEIASVLEISESTSKSQYSRAKRLLRERLA